MLSIRGLSLAVGGRILVSEFSMELAPGERIVLQGPSGSGKSLLLRAIAWLIEPASGSLTLHGRSPEDLGAPRWRAEVTYVPQHPQSLGATPAEHYALVQALGAQQARPSSDPKELAESWRLPPEAWDKSWATLSGGEAQRAALAVAVSRESAVLLLDEPTSALDPATMAEVEASLAGRAAIWVTHDDAQAERLGGRRLSL